MYNYQTQRPNLFTDEGQRAFLKVRDKVLKYLKESGAVRSGEIVRGCGCASSWDELACLDRMVELGEITEVTHPGTMGQYRVFVAKYTDV